MMTEGFSKKFIFNEKIDSDYLFSLYADDYPYIEEVFATTLQHYDDDLEVLKVAFGAGSVSDMKKAVHKLKPVFGFVGLTTIQEEVKKFEDLCQKVQTVDELKVDYKQIVTILGESKDLITSEYIKLKAFNANPL